MRNSRPCLAAVAALGLGAWVAGCNGGGGPEDADASDDARDGDAGSDPAADPAADPDADYSEDAPPPDAVDGREDIEDAAGEDAPPAPPVVTIDPVDPHWFSSGGRLLYVAGYYPSIAALTVDQTDYTGFYRSMIDRQADNGINYFRQTFTMGQPFGEAMVPYERTGPGEAADGRPKVDLSRFNEAYFDYWRRVVEYAGTKDIIVQVTILDTWHNKQWVVEDGDPQHAWGMQYDFYGGANNVSGIDTRDVGEWTDPSHPVFEVQQALVLKVVDALGDLPNLVWEIANENYYNADWELGLADLITGHERASGLPVHLVMPRDLPNHDSAGGKGNDPATVHAQVAANFPLGRPLIADNDGGGETDAAGRRRKAWATLTAGGHIDYFHFEMFRQDVLDSADVAEGMRYVGLTRAFVEDLGVDLRGMAPGDGLASSGWCLAAPGERYIVYLPSGGSTTLDGLAGSYEAFWFNPRDGAREAAGGGPEFAAPDGEDWVLFVRSTP